MVICVVWELTPEPRAESPAVVIPFQFEMFTQWQILYAALTLIRETIDGANILECYELAAIGHEAAADISRAFAKHLAESSKSCRTFPPDVFESRHPRGVAYCALKLHSQYPRHAIVLDIRPADGGTPIWFRAQFAPYA